MFRRSSTSAVMSSTVRSAAASRGAMRMGRVYIGLGRIDKG